MADSPANESPARYRFIRQIGRGGMGVVELVFDTVRGEEVARKRVLDSAPDAQLRFKREFRTVEVLRHPNLVTLHELGDDALGLFFTMEVVRGQGLLVHCRPTDPAPRLGHDSTLEAPAVSPHADTHPIGRTRACARIGEAREDHAAPPMLASIERIDRVVPQIIDALEHLHASGIVHRDLKPGNVMVRSDGVVKLLDFGVVAVLSEGALRAAAPEIVGTLGYMAPEQLRGEAPTAAVDLYALGVLLFELFTGSTPFAGKPIALVFRQMIGDPPRLADVAPRTPARYADLVAALLAREPSQRPSLADARRILRLAGAGPRARPITVPPKLDAGAALVGREVLQASLRGTFDAAMAGTFAIVALLGPTGAGKTTVGTWLADEATAAEHVVLRGRGRPTESVAFNALDGALDMLAAMLRSPAGAPFDEVLAVPLEAAATLFPVLSSSGAPPSIAAARAEGFAGVAAVIRAIAERSGLVLLVDDLQWADEDSIALLDHLAAAKPPRTLVLATVRDDVGESSGLTWARRHPAATVIPVGPLSSQATQIIVERAARLAGHAPGAETLSRLADACDGRPFLAEIAGRSLSTAVGLSDWVSSAVAALGANSSPRGVLAALVAADGFRTASALAHAVGETVGTVEDALDALEASGLVRRAGPRGAGTADVYHDALRAALARAVGEAALVAAHAAFVERGTALADTSVFGRVRHLRGAGRVREASALARDAASVAEKQRAYGFAAEMYAVALLHAHPERDAPALLRARGAALERVGKYGQAAACYRELVALATDAAADAEARYLLAHALLGANEIRDGYAELDRALTSRGWPALGAITPRGLFAAAAFMVGPIARPPPMRRVASVAERARLERDVRTAGLVGFFDPVGGVQILRRVLAGCVAAGAREEAAWCDYLLAYMAMLGSSHRGAVPLAERYRARGDARLGGVPATKADVRAAARLVDSLAAWRDGRWDEAAAIAEGMLETLAEAHQMGTHPQLVTLMVRAEIELYRQDIFAFELQLRRFRAASAELGEVGMRCQFELLEVLLRLARGEFEDAEALLVDLQRIWPSEVRTFQRMLIDGEMAYAKFLLGDIEGALRALHFFLTEHRAYRPLRSMYAGMIVPLAALVEVAALRAGLPGASEGRVRRYAKMTPSLPPLAPGRAVRALAYLAELRGDDTLALSHFIRAEAVAAEVGQRVDVAIAKYQRGVRLGGDEGAQLVADARALAATIGFSDRWLNELPPPKVGRSRLGR